MKYYISDLHLFHPAILQKCSRPFATIDDMHRTIFQNWKKKGIEVSRLPNTPTWRGILCREWV